MKITYIEFNHILSQFITTTEKLQVFPEIHRIQERHPQKSRKRRNPMNTKMLFSSENHDWATPWEGRIKFERPEGAKNSVPFLSAIVIFRPQKGD